MSDDKPFLVEFDEDGQPIISPADKWEAWKFPWGSAVRSQETAEWTHAFLLPDGREIRLEGLNVVLHDNGIEFADHSQGDD